MGQCSSLNKDILTSSVIAGWLQDSDRFTALLAAELPLRGKAQQTTIYELKAARHPSLFDLD
jgi:hypothetical protein